MDEAMYKIAIIGPSGAGKSALATNLRGKLHIRVYHLDRLLWMSDWKRIDRERRIDILQYLVWERRWIIDGTYTNSSELHLDEADVIIYLDISSFKCCCRVIKRHFEIQKHRRHDIPEGCSDRLTLPGILKILFFPFGARRKLENKLSKFPPEKVIRLQSSEEIERFLAHLEPYANEQAQPLPSRRKKKRSSSGKLMAAPSRT